jgi:uncharacterized protein YajQ (UPF0234 family)
MSSDNPTEYDEEIDEIDEIEERDFDKEKEDFIRAHMARQRELHRKSLAAMADLASANAEMILMSGINEASAKRVSLTIKDTTNDVAEELLKQQVAKAAKQENDNEMMINRLRQALNPNVE